MFNKTVGLRDTWAKKKPKPQAHQNNRKPQKQQSQRKPIDVIKQLGKKYTNYPEEKQQKVRDDILELANNVTYEELQPLFSTAAKKVGTRIATMLTLGVLLKKGLVRNEDIKTFINRGLEDTNELLVNEAKEIIND